MMKKLLIFLCFPVLIYSQGTFLKGIGIFACGTESAHFYDNLDEDKKDFANDNPSNFKMSYYYPQSHISREYFSWGAGLFAEFINRDNLRWQTELEYVKKGAKEKEVIDPFIGTRSNSWGVNKYTYIQWNNYLKLYNAIGYGSHWYLMPGVKIEYLFQKSASVFTPVSGSFPRFWFSGNLGAGYEFPLFRKFFGFVEYHWNPDVIKHKHDNIKVRNRTFELRAGIIWRPKRRGVDDCNTPRYKGPAY